MEKTIIKFKNYLKSFQANRKKLLTECEKELNLLNRIIEQGIKILKEYSITELNNKITLARMFGYNDNIISNITNGKRKQKIESAKQLLNTYNTLLNFYTSLNHQHLQTRDIINAFENDKIKDPINNISDLFSQIKYTNLTIEEISIIIGMGISFNSQYAKKNKNHQIQHIEMIDALSNYYNPDGTFKYNENTQLFNYLLKTLDEMCYDDVEMIYRILNSNKICFYTDIVTLLEKNNQKIKSNQATIQISDEKTNTPSNNIPQKTIKALQTLRKYYKNGTIIEIPENLNEFYTILSQCELSEEEQKYIIKLVKKKISNNNLQAKSSYLTQEEQYIYQTATSLLNSFDYSNGDDEVLKQYLEELQTILQMLINEDNEENKQYLLNEIPSIIEQLSIICDRYETIDNISTNNLIFLLDKNGIPFVFNDIEKLEQTNKKAIYSLIKKINQSNQSQFRKVLTNEPLSYNMYEVLNNRAHLSFVEIDAGIYIIIGADIPRNGYKNLNNRLKANQSTIKQIESTVKNPTTRNNTLKFHEQFITELVEQKSKTYKLTL